MSTKALILIFCVHYSYENDSYDSYQISDTNCGNNSKTIQSFIIGGDNAEEFPFMALITIEGQHYIRCGATLISSGYALTAAHCLVNHEKQNFSLLMGTNDIRNQTRNQTLFIINQRITPECYGQRELGYYDIALIRLTNGIQMNDKIQTICLPPKNTEPIGNDIFVLGWGISRYTEEKIGEKSLLLQKAKMELRSEEYCRAYSSFRALGTDDMTLTGDKLCLKSETSTACTGDSGGPAFQKVNEKWYQIGICSNSPRTFPDISLNMHTYCFISAPVSYVKTSVYIDWIQNSIKNYWNSSEEFVKTKC